MYNTLQTYTNSSLKTATFKSKLKQINNYFFKLSNTGLQSECGKEL